MAHLITLDEHPETVALVLTVEEAAKIKWLVGCVTCRDDETTSIWDALIYDKINTLYETMELQENRTKTTDLPVLSFRKLK